ncbi:MAG: sortase [Clostridiales bacterium]|nr:sortase [Clostridiales bacterium]
MRNKAGIVFIALGAVLILSALLLLLYNRHEAALAGKEAEILLSDVEAAIGGQTSSGGPTDPTEETETEPTLPPELPVVHLNGYDYVGYVEIPALELKLPVMATWDYDLLQVAPCRQFGSSRTDDLVIAAHNYVTHFGYLKKLIPGDTVIFTDMDGIVNNYAVEKTETLDPTSVDAVKNSGCDLVLYTCTIGGKTRVCVFCNRVPE